MNGQIGGKRRKRLQNTRGALVVIASLLIGSGLLRLTGPVSQAIALENPDLQVTALDPVPGSATGAANHDLEPMLAAFQAREARIAQQEEALRNRLQALRVAEEEIDKKLAALTKAEEDLRAMIAFAETAAEGDLERLTKVYETMKPKQASALFEEMTPEFAAGFLGRMRPEAAAAILAGLSPEAAHAFSVVLAGRNSQVPRE